MSWANCQSIKNFQGNDHCNSIWKCNHIWCYLELDSNCLILEVYLSIVLIMPTISCFWRLLQNHGTFSCELFPLSSFLLLHMGVSILIKEDINLCILLQPTCFLLYCWEQADQILFIFYKNIMLKVDVWCPSSFISKFVLFVEVAELSSALH